MSDLEEDLGKKDAQFSDARIASRMALEHFARQLGR
jgi:hypothetical protein